MQKPKILLSGNLRFPDYVDAVTQGGGIPTAGYLPEIDLSYNGLILCGGNDIDPSYYGEEKCGSVNLDAERDRVEFALLKAFVDAGKPVMGICRGCQLINVFFGGSMHQHLANATAHCAFGDFDLVHPVRAVEGSFMESLYGKNFTVNSYHHQAAKDLGKGLEVSMTSLDGTVIEGIAHKTLPVFGVQWHPERMTCSKRREDTVDGMPLFRYFVDMCKAHCEQD